MPEIAIEQALYQRAADGLPHLQVRSPGFGDGWLPDVEQLLVDFGERPVGVRCPAAVFAQPLGKSHVAIVQVTDKSPVSGVRSPESNSDSGVNSPDSGHRTPDSALRTLCFQVLVLPRDAYRRFLGDPFAVADRFPPPWGQLGFALPSLAMPAQPLPLRTVADVQQVLKRVKAHALSEDVDPTQVELTVENAESPALLGGVQILVDGGRLVFVRPAPDPGLIRGLWTLLPSNTRCELWPATFAFSNALEFDAVVVPRTGGYDFSGYTTEAQAAEYPAGRYELALQTAAECGDQTTLDQLFARRSTGETLRLAVLMVVALALTVLMLRFIVPPPSAFEAPRMLSPEQREQMALAAAMVGNRDPFAAAALHEEGRYRRAERIASAAGIVASVDPFAAIVQARTAHARYVEIWKGGK